jgi:hypothetical protein
MPLLRSGSGAMSKLNQEFDEDELLGELEVTEAGAETGHDPDGVKNPPAKHARAADGWKEYLKEGETETNPKSVRLAKDRWRKEERKKAHKVKKGTKHS